MAGTIGVMRTRHLIPLASIAAVLALSACGSGSQDAGVASIDGDSASGATATTAKSNDRPSAEESQQAMLDFAKCMREHGVDMPDPEFQGNGTGKGGFVKVNGG